MYGGAILSIVMGGAIRKAHDGRSWRVLGERAETDLGAGTGETGESPRSVIRADTLKCGFRPFDTGEAFESNNCAGGFAVPGE